MLQHTILELWDLVVTGFLGMAAVVYWQDLGDHRARGHLASAVVVKAGCDMDNCVINWK